MIGWILLAAFIWILYLVECHMADKEESKFKDQQNKKANDRIDRILKNLPKHPSDTA